MTNEIGAISKPLEGHRVVLVTGTPFYSDCIRCGETMNSGIARVFADLDGKPWQDYYCESCAIFAGAKLA